jgi:hypothetical protein
VARELAHEFSGDLAGPLVVAPRDPDEARVVGICAFVLQSRFQPVEKPADLWVGDAVVGESVECRQVSTSSRGAAGRHVGGLIPSENRGGRLEIAVLREKGS